MLAVLAVQAGCSAIWPRVEVADTTPPVPLVIAAPSANNGSIF